MRILINTLFVWFLLFNLSSLFVTLFPPTNATHCLWGETTQNLDRWLYRTTLINLVVISCLAILFNLIHWLMEDPEEEGDETLEKCYRWLTTHFPFLLLTILYIIASIIIVIQCIYILAECQYNSLSSLYASIHCLNVLLFFSILTILSLKPLFQMCRDRFYQ